MKMFRINFTLLLFLTSLSSFAVDRQPFDSKIYTNNILDRGEEIILDPISYFGYLNSDAFELLERIGNLFLTEAEKNIILSMSRPFSAFFTWAVFNEVPVVYNFLLGRSTEINGTGDGHTLLYFAVSFEEEDIVRHLIQLGAHIDLNNDIFFSLLEICIQNGKLEIFQLLLDSRLLDSRSLINENLLLFDFAIGAQNDKIISLFLERSMHSDFDVNQCLDLLENALKKKNSAIVKLLIDAGFTSEVTQDTFFSLLEICTQNDNPEMFQLLLDSSPLANESLLLFDFAIRTQNDKIISLLLKRSMHLEFNVKQCLDFLEKALEKKNSAIVKLLLDAGFTSKVTPNAMIMRKILELAIKSGSLEIVQLFVNHGIGFDETMVVLAQRNHYQDIVDYLEFVDNQLTRPDFDDNHEIKNEFELDFTDSEDEIENSEDAHFNRHHKRSFEPSEEEEQEANIQFKKRKLLEQDEQESADEERLRSPQNIVIILDGGINNTIHLNNNNNNYFYDNNPLSNEEMTPTIRIAPVNNNRNDSIRQVRRGPFMPQRLDFDRTY